MTHRVLSQNIANVNTPGYHTQRLDFQAAMKQLRSTDSDRQDPDNLPIEKMTGLKERVDGNNVNMEKEVAALNKNAIAYQVFAKLMASRLSTMQRAISG